MFLVPPQEMLELQCTDFDRAKEVITKMQQAMLYGKESPKSVSDARWEYWRATGSLMHA